MLLRDFFPRLQTRAWERYGVRLTKRQFTNWREKGLLPGPAAPIGRGRGRCPDRHWPATSYRRALRICRYKSGEAHRLSEWLLGFWLCGDPIDISVIRTSLERELSIERGRHRAFTASNRWRKSMFKSAKDVDRGGMSGGGDIGHLLPLLGITPDQFRRLMSLSLVEDDKDEDIALMQEMGDDLYDIDADILAEVRAGIGRSEYKRAYRPGLLAESRATRGNQFGRLSADQIAAIPDLWRLGQTKALLVFHTMRLMGDMPLERLGFLLLPRLAGRPKALKNRIDELIRIAFEISIDVEEGMPSDWRLTGAHALNENMMFTIQSLIQEKRNGLR